MTDLSPADLQAIRARAEAGYARGTQTPPDEPYCTDDVKALLALIDEQQVEIERLRRQFEFDQKRLLELQHELSEKSEDRGRPLPHHGSGP